MYKIMKNDGKCVLKEYFLNICVVMRIINQDFLRIVEMVNEYC